MIVKIMLSQSTESATILITACFHLFFLKTKTPKYPQALDFKMQIFAAFLNPILN